MTIYKQIKENVKNADERSAWSKGIKAYALEFLEDLESNPSLIEEFNEGMPIREKNLLNGAIDWHQYSEGGCAFCYDEDIAERLCTPSELKRFKGGNLPNDPTYWIRTQSRALIQASNLILRNQRILQLNK